MTDERPDETLTPVAPVTPVTNDALDREIEHLLAVDPSPEFLAKVRARLDAEPAPAAWRFRWRPVAAGATAVAVLVLAVVVSRPTPSLTDASVEPATVARADDITLPSVVTPTGAPDVVVTAAPSPPPVAEPTSAPEPAVPVEPVPTPGDVAVTPMPTPPPPASAVSPPGPPRFSRVVISEAEAAALRRLFAQVRAQQVILSAPAPPLGPIASLVPPQELVIPPIAIEPLTLALLEEGGLQ